MDCSRIPPADRWNQASVQQVKEYRRHVQYCRACRLRCLSAAPEQLLFELNDSSLPEDFWIGFWDSLEKRLPVEVAGVRHPIWRVTRWAAVFISACLLIVFHQDLSESPSSKRGGPQPRPLISPAAETPTYPLIDDLKNPKATYYIFQPSEKENIVMVFDPDLEL